MAQYSINYIRDSEYFVRPTKKEDRLAILQLLLNKKNLLYFWFSITIGLACIAICIIATFYLFMTLVWLPAWHYIQIYGLEIKLFSYLLICFPFFLWPVFYIPYWAISFSQDLNNGYVAVSNKKILGFVSFTKFLGKDYLVYLTVDPKYRKRGIATCLVKTIIKEKRSPIYVFLHSYPRLTKFFTRLGFKQHHYRVFLFWQRKDKYHLGYEKMDILEN